MEDFPLPFCTPVYEATFIYSILLLECIFSKIIKQSVPKGPLKNISISIPDNPPTMFFPLQKSAFIRSPVRVFYTPLAIHSIIKELPWVFVFIAVLQDPFSWLFIVLKISFKNVLRVLQHPPPLYFSMYKHTVVFIEVAELKPASPMELIVWKLSVIGDEFAVLGGKEDLSFSGFLVPLYWALVFCQVGVFYYALAIRLVFFELAVDRSLCFWVEELSFAMELIVKKLT